MTRPHIIRADTIDLQDQDAPSAKDHTRQPVRPSALGEGSPAPHQADALKHVELELSEQHGRSPRHSQDLSGKELQLLHEDTNTYGADGIGQDSNNLLHNAGASGAGAGEDRVDADGDDSMDEDMMDKISSSPSIGDDGGYYLPLPRPTRGTFLRSKFPSTEKAPSPKSPFDDFSSSPFSETPTHFPLPFPRNEQDQTPSRDHHQKGGYAQDGETLLKVDDLESERRDHLSPLISEQRESHPQEEFEGMEESYEVDFNTNDFKHLLLPADDPLLDNSFDDASLSPSSTDSSSPASRSSWNDKEQETQDDDDDTEGISFLDDSRFIDSGWGGECLREVEDIDFEFVYALHTFVATVEGQANATKGDTMVLLDDSNSYWWLVRVVKDSSIGYLPAEHIETPLERLARLNKHRNLDLSSTMLGDEEEKKPGNPLNPLKKAMRRRNAKTVQFAAPSYVEPSDVEYSTDEEDGNGEYIGLEQDRVTAQSNDQGRPNDDGAAVEPLQARGPAGLNGERVTDQGIRDVGVDQGSALDLGRTSEDALERPDDGAAAKSRKGTVRDTDSFYKEGNETRKINLTPSLLREDSNGAGLKSNDAKDLKSRASIDSLEKDAPPEKGKEDKKRKEIRGMLGGMFKRKDKKSKGQDKEFEDNEKTSGEPLQQALSPPSRLSPQPKESMETLTQEGQASKAASQPLRQTSKLQKSPPAQIPPKSSYSQREAASQRTPNADPQIVFQAESTSQRLPVSEQQTSFISGSTSQPGFADEKSKFIPEPQSQRTAVTGQPNDSIPEPSRPPPIVSEPVGSMRLVQPEPDMGTEDSARALNFNPLMTSRDEQIQSESPRDGRRGMFSQIQDALRSSPSEPDAEKAKPRMHIDDFDTSEEEEHEPTFQRESLDEPDSHLSIAQNAQYVSYEPQAPTSFQPHIEQAKERLSESPVEVSPPQDRYRTPQPPPLMVDTSSQEDPSTSPISPVSSPELIEASNEKAGREETPASTAQSSTPTWSDASLRAYLDDDSDIRDLLVVVHDKSQFKPIVGRDHPAVQTLFKEENRKLGEISNRLDGLLGDYLARKQGTAVR